MTTVVDALITLDSQVILTFDEKWTIDERYCSLENMIDVFQLQLNINLNLLSNNT